MIEQTPTLYVPQLKDLLDLLKRDIMINFNCHAIAKIESFDAEKRTVKAKMLYCKTVYVKDKETLVEYPLLLDVPVVILGGGNGRLTFPIAKGDECLILFNDRDIDNWMAGAKSGPVRTTRLHSFADAMALVGFLQVSSYDTTRVKLSNGDTFVGISDSKIKIANNLTSLNECLADLIDKIKAISTTNAVPGLPCTLSPASIAQLDLIKTKIAGLLE